MEIKLGSKDYHLKNLRSPNIAAKEKNKMVFFFPGIFIFELWWIDLMVLIIGNVFILSLHFWNSS